MKTYADLNRQERIAKVLAKRKSDFVLVLENLVEEKNISAILRTAESFGVGKICVIHADKKPRLSMNTSSGAAKWLTIEFFTSTSECINKLKKDGFQVVGGVVNPESKILWDQQFNGKVAIMVGNEPHGLTQEAEKLLDESIYIPMLGLTESLNVSVSAAILLYEVIRQKEKNIKI